MTETNTIITHYTHQPHNHTTQTYQQPATPKATHMKANKRMTWSLQHAIHHITLTCVRLQVVVRCSARTVVCALCVCILVCAVCLMLPSPPAVAGSLLRVVACWFLLGVEMCVLMYYMGQLLHNVYIEVEIWLTCHVQLKLEMRRSHEATHKNEEEETDKPKNKKTTRIKHIINCVHMCA